MFIIDIIPYETMAAFKALLYKIIPKNLFRVFRLLFKMGVSEKFEKRVRIPSLIDVNIPTPIYSKLVSSIIA